MKRALSILVAVCAAIIILLVLLGGKQSETEWEPYIVRPGDTLYDIAEEIGAGNPAKFSYEVCEKNGIPYGGLIFPGEIILIYTEAE